MKIDNRAVLGSNILYEKKENKNTSNPQNTYKNNYNKIFLNLSFGAAISQALININGQDTSKKSEIDDVILNLLHDIKNGTLKTDNSEIEEVNKLQTFIFQLLEKYLGNDEEYIHLKQNNDIMLCDVPYLLKDKNLQLDDSEKKYLSDFLTKNDKNESNLSDKKLISNAVFQAERIFKSYYDKLWAIDTQMQNIKNQRKLSDEEFNKESVFQNFKNNIAPKLSFKELDIVHDILSNIPFFNNNKQDIINKAVFDYTILSKRKIASFVNQDNWQRHNYYDELLFCNDKEFEEKITKLNKRTFLKQNLNNCNVPFSLWKKLLDMNDDEYNKITIPIEEKKFNNFNADEYRRKMQLKMKEPLQFDKKEIEELLKEYFSLNSILDNNKNFQKRIDFKQLESQKTVKSILPDTTTLFNELKLKGTCFVKIPNRGGANPVNSEKALIQKEDEIRLEKRENAGIKVKYGEKINWSNEKISRDIIQNFFDGNGHTLEGVTFSVVGNKDGKYTIRVEGAGNYDYSHLQSLGDTTKDDDEFAAGTFGEGTRIAAVNLLSKLGTSYVKYGCGDWSMEFNRSSDDIKTADMTQTLTKNPKKIYGNYIEFNTDNENLVKSILDAKDYFYHPDNPDFQNLDFENEYFGLKFMPYEQGNLYLVQRYEHNGKISNSLPHLSIVFKTNPNSEELVKLNNGEEYNPNTGRDRIQISNDVLSQLFSRYLKTVNDEDLVKIICTLEPCFNNYTAANFEFSEANNLLYASLHEAEKRELGINFGNYIASDDKETIEYAQALGYKTARSTMNRVGMKSIIEEKKKEPLIEPDETITSKIRLLNEGVKVFEEYIDLSTIHLIHPGEADAPKYPFKDKEFTNIKAEAIINYREYKGHWVKTNSFIMCDYINNLATWLHELSHKSGGDNSSKFSIQLIEMEKFLMNVLIHNPEALEKIKILAELYNNEKLNHSTNFNEKEYEMSIKNSLNTIQPYEEYREKINSTNLPVYIQPKEYRYNKREAEIPTAIKSILPKTEDIIKEINTTGTAFIELKDRGRTNPINIERALIQKEDEENLGKQENARIKIKYGAKVNWGNEKISRDIMQNFFDGNGHTLEGTKFNIIKNENGKYTVRVEGLGTYDYSHLKSLGDSTKDDDNRAAGNFGEGTRIVAVNLLSKLDTNYVKYGSGDWSMEFNRSSDDIKTADMTQTLTKNIERIKGNYIEFNTDNEDLVKSIIEAKDYFYHPDNPDFKNLDFENEFFGFRVQKDNGNLYYIQRFQTPDFRIEGGMRGLTVIFKQKEDAVTQAIAEQQKKDEKLQKDEFVEKPKSIYKRILEFCSNIYHKIFSKSKPSFISDYDFKFMRTPELSDKSFCKSIDNVGFILQNIINTGRDRNYLSLDNIYMLSFKYAQTMSDDDLVSAIENFEGLITSDNPDDIILNKNYDAATTFIFGIMQEAAKRNIEINSDDSKIVWVEESSWGTKLEKDEVIYLQNKGYKFGHQMYSNLGIKSAHEVFNNEHKKQSVEATKKELQKLEILNNALMLFKENDTKGIIPAFNKNPLRIYEKGEIKQNRAYHSIFSSYNALDSILIDRKTLAKDDFLTALTYIISETVNTTGNVLYSKYSYNLTDLIRLELESFLTNSENTQKLKVLEKLYKKIDNQ